MMAVLLWGLPADRPLADAHEELLRLGAAPFLLDQRDLLDTEVVLRMGAGGMTGWLRVGGRRLPLRDVTAFYPRPYDSRRLPAVAAEGPASPAWRHALAVEEALWTFAELTPALVVNRPSAMVGNNSKLWQLEQIRAHGFLVPPTLATTSPDQVRAFWAEQGELIFKSLSGVRSRVTRLRPDQAGRLDDVAWCPTQFQRRIKGRDHRVHVVGEQVFACEVRSEADDYRYAAHQSLADAELRATELPAAVARRCRTLAAAMGLVVAGIDLRRTPRGAWYCFEVNPSPAYSYYEQRTGQPICAAIARLLATGDRAAWSP